jgi:hypothetical protein
MSGSSFLHEQFPSLISARVDILLSYRHSPLPRLNKCLPEIFLISARQVFIYNGRSIFRRHGKAVDAVHGRILSRRVSAEAGLRSGNANRNMEVGCELFTEDEICGAADVHRV